MKKRLANIGLSFLAVVVSVILIELACRYFAPRLLPVQTGDGLFWTYDTLLGWAPGAFQRRDFDRGDFSMHVETNSQGLRDREFSYNKTAAQKRMLILGDSYTWGFGVEQSESFPKLLERRHPDWEIINAGVNGYSTDQEYLYFIHRGLRYHPDVVLLEFCENDLAGNTDPKPRWYNKPVFTIENDTLNLQNFPVPRSSVSQQIKRFVSGETAFLSRVLFYSLRTIDRLKKLFSSDDSANSLQKRRWLVTQKIIHELNATVRQSGARLIVVSVPASQTSRQRLEALLTDEQAPFLPLDKTFSGKEDTAYLLYRDHWNRFGHALAAIAIDRYLAAIGVFSSPETPGP